MIFICDIICQRQHLPMKTILIPLCKHSSDRYHFNILIIIAIIYHIYIESGVGWGGVPWVLWRRPWTCACFNQAGGLTFQPNYPFRIAVRITFPQEIRELSSAYHLWLGTCDRDHNLTVYRPLYLRKGFCLFCCHDSTQWWEYNQGLTS